jgi:hypothetical protein
MAGELIHARGLDSRDWPVMFAQERIGCYVMYAGASALPKMKMKSADSTADGVFDPVRLGHSFHF